MPERSETYTHGHAESVLRSHRWRTVDNSAAYLADRLSPGTEVLDVGCGPGTITIDIAERVAPGRVVGLDAAADAIAAARSAADDAGVTNLELATGDVYALEHADDSFDVVHAHQVLQHVADPVAALREMRRVCRPDGVVGGTGQHLPGHELVPRLPGARPLAGGVLRRRRGQRRRARRRQPAPPWALEAGFTAVAASASAWCYATDDERAWWGGLWADRVETTALGTRAVELGLATPARARRAGRRLAGVGGHARRLVRRPPRRDPRHPVTPAALGRAGVPSTP